MSIEKRLERIEAILDARGLDWDHPRVEDDHFVDASKMVAEEPPKKWRRLTDEFVQPGDWMNAKVNRQDVDPPEGGWIPADPCYFGRRACTLSMYFARPPVDEPAKETEHPAGPKPIMESYRPVDDGDIGKIVEVQNSTADPWRECTLLAIDWDRPYGFLCRHGDPVVATQWLFARIKIDEPTKEPEPEYPAGPMPDPGKGYRILSKNPPEDLNPNAEWWDGNEDRWCGIFPTNTTAQHPRVWYRLKIEPAEPEYREPVLPADVGKACQFNNDGDDWTEAKLQGYAGCFWISVSSEAAAPKIWDHARIKKDA